MAIELEVLGRVHSTRREVSDDEWDRETASIELDGCFRDEARLGLGDFSHVGILAQRGKNRANRICTTRCRVKRRSGTSLFVEGLDAVDGTPVLDIKPSVAESGARRPVTRPAWITELMEGYWHA